MLSRSARWLGVLLLLEAVLLAALAALILVQILGFREFMGEIFGAKPPLDWGYLLGLVGVYVLLIGSLALAGVVFVRAGEGARIRSLGRLVGWAALAVNALLFVTAIGGAFQWTELREQVLWIGASIVLLGVFLWLYAVLRASGSRSEMSSVT